MDETEVFMIETEIIKHDYDTFKKNEDLLYSELDSNRFFEILENVYGYDYKTISKFIDGCSYNFNERHEFNIALRSLRKTYNISMVEAILYLEDSITMSNILKFIDDETEWVLKDELSNKYGIKENNKLFDILY